MMFSVFGFGSLVQQIIGVRIFALTENRKPKTVNQLMEV